MYNRNGKIILHIAVNNKKTENQIKYVRGYCKYHPRARKYCTKKLKVVHLGNKWLT